MINYKENYNKWLEDNFFDEETREELSNLIDEKEIEDRSFPVNIRTTTRKCTETDKNIRSDKK